MENYGTHLKKCNLFMNHPMERPPFLMGINELNRLVYQRVRYGTVPGKLLEFPKWNITIDEKHRRKIELGHGFHSNVSVLEGNDGFSCGLIFVVVNLMLVDIVSTMIWI
jgi:hypothetical protein